VSVGALGRITPPDFDHVAASPLKALGAAVPTCVPVSIGVPWYTAFDTPRQLHDGSWHLPDASRSSLGSVRGGHCVCLAPMGYFKGTTPAVQAALWRFYNQGQEGACEGFGHARAQSIIRGGTFDAFWLYDEARKLEGTYPEGEGTTNRTVCEVLEREGLRRQTSDVAEREVNDGPIEEKLGISKYRWATTAEEVCNALGRPNAFAVPLLNSWGEGYPEVVWLPVDTLDRLLREEGEADVVSER
jgi:hypothetical protein